ncbi:MAG: TetR/AcrR family transcriptional regulator [Burkholderiales bacterium]
MAQRKPPRRTRERILETSLALFNRLGEPNVTTADIADEMNISPGNLYYHFRNKDDIIADLFALHESAVTPLLAVPDTPPPGVEDLWFMLHVAFEKMREYRFLYRDLDEITSRNRKLATRVADLLRRLERTMVEFCRVLVRTGQMQASEREIAALAANAALVSIYWMSWQRITSVPARTGAAAPEMNLGQAAYQVLALIAPFLVGDHRALIERLGADYL